MKKRKIQKLLAVFLAAATSVTAMPAGETAAGCAGLKSVFAAEKNENTGTGEQKTWLLQKDSEYSEHGYSITDRYVMPGDRVEFKGESSSYSELLYGTWVTYILSKSAFSIDAYNTDKLKSGDISIDNLEMKAFRNDAYFMDSGKEETDLTDVKAVNGAVAFNNNTGKALKIISWSEGPLAAYNVYSSPGASIPSRGHTYRQRGITVYAYEPEYLINYDLQGGNLQNEQLPDRYQLSNEPFTLHIACPVKEGQHFYRWEGNTLWGNGSCLYPDENLKKNGQDHLAMEWDASTCAYRDTSLKATYTSGETVTFHGAGGMINGLDSWIYEVDYKDGRYIEPDLSGLRITKNGYVFNGWYMDEKYTRPYYGINDDRTYDMNGDGVFDSSDKALGAPFSYYSYDMHLYAKWEPVHRHSYVNWKWDKKNHWKTCECSAAGISSPHKYSSWKYDKKQHWKKCACGSVISKKNHQLVTKNTRKATVKQTGYTGDKICSTCGYMAEQGKTVPKIKPALPKKGKICTSGQYQYKITASSKTTRTVTLLKSTSKTLQKANIPSAVTISGYTYKVTAISAKAFCGNTRLKEAVISKNIKTVGSQAFSRCKNLGKITIQTSLLTKIEKNAFSGIKKNAKIYVPKTRYASCKKMLRKSGISSAAKIISR